MGRRETIGGAMHDPYVTCYMCGKREIVEGAAKPHLCVECSIRAW